MILSSDLLTYSNVHLPLSIVSVDPADPVSVKSAERRPIRL